MPCVLYLDYIFDARSKEELVVSRGVPWSDLIRFFVSTKPFQSFIIVWE